MASSVSIENLQKEQEYRKINRERYQADPKGYAEKLYWYIRFMDKKLWNRARAFSRDSGAFDGLSWLGRRRLLKDIFVWDYVYGYGEGEYFLFDFPKKSQEERLAYLPDMDMIQEVLEHTTGDAKARFLAENKWERYQMFQPLFKRDVAPLLTREDLPLAQAFLRKHHDFIVKPNDDFGGHGVEIFHIREGEEAQTLEKLTARMPLIFEELIVQSEEMAYLNPSSVNTVRVTTFMGGGQYEIAFVALRVGRANAVVDNVSSGGLAGLVDLDSHKVLCNRFMATSHIIDGTLHPDSGKPLAGFALPDWDGLMDAVGRGIALFPKGGHYAGWDFCHTAQGWCLVECNDTGFFNPYQACNQQGAARLFHDTMAKYVALGE